MIEEGVRIIGNVTYGAGVSIAAPAELMAKGSSIKIGENCDIAAFVTISTADSHARCIGRSTEIERKPIVIGNNVFIGTGATILGGCEIGDNCVIGAGVVLKNVTVPPFSRVRSAEPIFEPGYYEETE